MCTWVNKEIWCVMKTCFPDEKQINQYPKSTLCKECTYVQEEKIKVRGILIPHQIINIPFHHHVFLKTYS